MSKANDTPIPFRVNGTRLTVEAEEKPDAHGNVYWQCRCDCGTRKRVRRDHVRRGATQSCGCLASEVHAARMAGRAKHHLYGTRIWSVWSAMRHRCQNPDARKWEHYGGRGIRVCPEWESVEVFRDHILTLLPPGSTDIPKGLQIDRHPDNDGHYEPGNIRFVPSKRNNRNRRTTRMITAFGVMKAAGDWADQTGIPVRLIRSRIDRQGWTPEDAVSRPA